MVSQSIKVPIAPAIGAEVHDCVVLSKDNQTTVRENCSVANHYVCRYNYLHNAIIQVSTERMTWNGADEACQEIGAQMLSLHSAEQKRVINTLLVER